MTLATALAEFEGSITATNTSREDHISARAALKNGSDELVQLVDMMDGINRYRLRNDPPLLVAWDAAKHVVTRAAGEGDGADDAGDTGDADDPGIDGARAGGVRAGQGEASGSSWTAVRRPEIRTSTTARGVTCSR